MKKLLIALFSLLFIFPSCGANTLLSPKSTTLKTALEYFIPDLQTRGDALAAYHAFVKENGGGINQTQLNQVCNIGGLDRNQCTAFVRALGEQFKDACDNNTDSPDCIKLFKKVNTQMRQGTAIAQAWAKTKEKDIIVCEDEKNIRKAWNDDYLSCYSVENPDINYEFQFDDLFESNDVTTEKSIYQASCLLAGLDFRSGGYTAGAGTSYGVVAGNATSWPDICVTKDKTKCNAVDAFSQEFGVRSLYSETDGGCTFTGNSVYDETEIINEYDDKIDNYVYSSGKDQSQLQAASSLDESIRMYAQTRLSPTPITSFYCDKSHHRWIRGAFQDNEDILTCHINGKRVDFVFDDLTQSTALWGRGIIQGSQQALGCRANDGIFNGEHCADLTESMCKQVAALNLSECPECKAAYWDADKQICMLPESSEAKITKRRIRVITNTGVAVVALVATYMSGGSVLMITAASVATAAAAVSDGAKFIQDNDASDWVVEMNQIQTPEAADKFLSEHLEEIMGADHLVAQRRNGVDEMLSRVLANASDEYFYELVAGCALVTEHNDGTTEIQYDTSLPDCALNPDKGSNTLSTVIRVADAVQFIAGVVMIVAGLTQTAQTVTNRATNIVDKIDDLKTTGWIRKNGQWYNQTTKQTVSTLPKGQPGWDPGVKRWRGSLYGKGNVGSFTKKADLIRWIVGPSLASSVTSMIAGAANVVVSHSPENPANVKIPERASTPGNVTDVNVPGNNTKPGSNTNTPPAGNTLGQGGGSGTSVMPIVANPLVRRADVNVQVNLVGGDKNQSHHTDTSRNITPHATQNKNNTALIATAAVAGTIGAGWLIGGLIGKDNDEKSSDMSVVSQISPELDQLMQNAGGVIGNVNGVDIKLIPLPTTVNSYAPIVDINGKAVIVADYRGYRLPYYMNPVTMRWEPLLGIGPNGGWFNTYPTPSQTGIPVIDSIAAQLTIKLMPMVVSRYVGQNSNDIHFPLAAHSAYQTINAEFLNGVVSINNGTMSPSDQMLYNSNYNSLRQKLQ